MFSSHYWRVLGHQTRLHFNSCHTWLTASRFFGKTSLRTVIPLLLHFSQNILNAAATWESSKIWPKLHQINILNRRSHPSTFKLLIYVSILIFTVYSACICLLTVELHLCSWAFHCINICMYIAFNPRLLLHKSKSYFVNLIFYLYVCLLVRIPNPFPMTPPLK